MQFLIIAIVLTVWAGRKGWLTAFEEKVNTTWDKHFSQEG